MEALNFGTVPVLLYVFAAAGPILGLGVAHLMRIHGEKREKNRRPANGPDSLFLPSVTAAHDLVPLIDKLITEFKPDKETKLQMMGGDSRYIALGNGKKLKKGIKSWIENGLNVEYILTDSDAAVKHRINELKQMVEDGQSERPSSGACLRIFLLDQDAKPSVLELANRFKTFHPTLFFGPGDSRAMWIEGRHPQDSEYAYRVRYVSPRAMANKSAEEEFEKHQKDIEEIMQSCSKIDEMGEVYS